MKEKPCENKKENPPCLSERQKEFLMMVESKIRKAEKETWLYDDHDHLIKEK